MSNLTFPETKAINTSKASQSSTYAVRTYLQAIGRIPLLTHEQEILFAQQGRAIRLPIHINEKLNKIKRVQRELSQKLGRIPTSTEIADALSLKPSQIREFLLLARQTISLDIRIGADKDIQLQDLIEDCSSGNVYNSDESLNEDVEVSLSNLPRQQQEVLNLHFGLTDGNELSLEQIGQRMGISRERVRQ